MNGKHVVVFGAGYVGSAVALRAIAEGASVTALTRNQQSCDRLEAIGCRVLPCRLENHDWHSEISDPDYVVNCVSSGRQGVEGYRKSYLEGALSIRSWGERFVGGPRLVYTGSTSVYPQGEGRIVDETMPTEAADTRSQLLINTESVLKCWPAGTTVLRLAGIYGPGRHHLLDQLRLGTSPLPGSGTQILNLIHREDIVSAIWSIWGGATHPDFEAFNVVDDGRAAKSEVIAWLADKLNRPTPSFSGLSTPGRRTQRPNRIISNHKLKSTRGWEPLFPTFKQGYDSILLGA